MYTRENYDRLSLKNALTKGDYTHAFEKINENLQFIDNNISQIEKYKIKLGSKGENNQIFEELNELINNTENDIKDTMNYIDDIKNFNYSSSSQKSENLNKVQKLEKQIQTKKNIFEKLKNSIKYQEQDSTKNKRNSIDSMEEIENSSDDSQKKKFLKGKKLQGIHEKEDQINIISDINNNLNNASKNQTEKLIEEEQKIDNIEENNIKNSHLANALEHMKEVKKEGQSNVGYTNYCLYAIGGIVLLLILLFLILPKSE